MSILACVTWYLFIEEANEQIKKDWNIRFVVLLLYPPFSVMMTGSSICFLGNIFREDAYLSRPPVSQDSVLLILRI